MLSKMKSLFGAQDMTTGNPLRSVLLFTVPLLMGNILQLLYSTVDSIVVGQYSGPNGLSAIGVSMPLQFLFSVFFMAVGTGVGVLISQFFGAKDKDNLSKTVGTSIVLTIITSIIATALGFLVLDWILKITNCPEEVYDNARAYIRVIFIGFIGMGFYNIFGGILRGVGNSTYPLIVLVGSTTLNIFLDIWFVAAPHQLPFGLGLGAAGAAWATIICQAISAIACLIRILTMQDIMTVKLRTIKITKSIAKLIVRIGLPSGLQQMVMSMSFMLVQSLINAIKIPFNGVLDGAVFLAVNTSAMRIDQFAIMPAQTFNMTASTYAGQNLGAGNIERVMKGLKSILLLAVGSSLVMVVIVLSLRSQLLSLFINDPDPARTELIISWGKRVMNIMIFSYPLMAIANTIGGVLRGAGDTMTQLVMSLCTHVAFRIPVSFLLVHISKSDEFPNGRPESIFAAMLISFSMHMIVNFIYFRMGRWKTKGITNRRPQYDT